MPGPALRAGATVGFHGKLPRAADYLRRNLASSFITPWSDWLHEVLTSAEVHLDHAFQEIYLTSPIWQFVLDPGVAGPSTVTGTFMPSVDRAGRFFPFTIAAILEEPVALAQFKAANRDWFRRAAALALESLEDRFDLDRGLERLGPPLSIQKAHPGETAEALLWSEGSVLVDPTSLRLAGLPARPLAGALIDGDWVEHGWPRRAPVAAKDAQPVEAPLQEAAPRPVPVQATSDGEPTMAELRSRGIAADGRREVRASDMDGVDDDAISPGTRG